MGRALNPRMSSRPSPSMSPKQRPASTADEVVAALGGSIDLLLDAGTVPGGLPSTIVDVTGPVPVLIRAGAVSWERVLEFFT